jgi:integrase/recombinase XerD
MPTLRKTPMNKPAKHPLPQLLQDFFCQRLQSQRNASPQTIASYRDTFRLLLAFVEQHHRCQPCRQHLEDWEAPVILRFLNHLEKARHNTPRTRNARLAAIRSFMRYVGQQAPETLGLTARVLAIPAKRYERPLVGYLSKPEMNALLKAPAGLPATHQRNRMLWSLLYNTGARISEILALDRQHIQWTPSPALQLHGKGRKQRLVPLWPQVALQLKQWLRLLSEAPDTPLFSNRFGRRLSRFGAHKQLQRDVRAIKGGCPSLARRKISPHTLRHTTAMHLLQADVDITVIALWLGHESPATTHHYIELDLQMKRDCLKKLEPPKTKLKRFRLGDPVLKFLNGL